MMCKCKSYKFLLYWNVNKNCYSKLIRIVSFSQQWEKRIVAREQSAFAKQNTKTRLTATTKQGGRSSVEGLFLFTLTEILKFQAKLSTKNFSSPLFLQRQNVARGNILFFYNYFTRFQIPRRINFKRYQNSCGIICVKF